MFKAFTTNTDQKLAVQCNMVSDALLYVEYTWPSGTTSMHDLDTGTEFNGRQVGFGCGDSDNFMYFYDLYEDSTGASSENVIVNLALAREEGVWANQTVIMLRAAWFRFGDSPPQAPGPATVTISLLNRHTGVVFGSQQAIIFPGQWSGCSRTTRVGAVVATATGAIGAETVSFALLSGEGGKSSISAQLPSSQFARTCQSGV